MLKKIFIFAFSLILVPVFCKEYFTGDGRSDLTIQVEKPELKNIGNEAEWLPDFVTNIISDDIAKFSNIKIVDIQNEKKVLDTQRRDEIAGYSDEEVYKALSFQVAKNVLLVSITGKNSSYALSIRINDKEKNVSIASHNNPNCLFEDLESGKVLKVAVADLLTQLNVTLTAEGKSVLLSVDDTTSNKSSIHAQKLAAQGQIYEQKGSNIQALSYYIQASASDKNLSRAVESMRSLSKVVAGGDFGSNARQLIQMRNDFKDLIANATTYFANNIPYYVVYNPEVKMGNINYEKETFEYLVKAAVVKDIEQEDIYKNICDAYDAQPDSKNWGLISQIHNILPEPHYYITFEIRDKSNRLLGATEKEFSLLTDTKQFALWREVPITVSANADTSDIVLSVSKVVSYRDKNNVEISRIPVGDYVNNIFVKSFELSEVIPGVSIVTLPNGKSQSDCNDFFKYFGFEKPYEIAKKLISGNAYKLSDIMYTKAESKIIEESKSSRYLNDRWNVYGNDDPQKYFLTGTSQFPRLKTEYIKKAARYLPIEFVKIPNSEYQFVKNTPELKFMLDLIDNNPINRYSYSYYRVVSLADIFTNSDLNIGRRVYAEGVNDKLAEILDFTSPIYRIKAIDKTNKSTLTSSDGEILGDTNNPLRDFTYYLSKNENQVKNVLALYSVNPKQYVKKLIPKFQEFTSAFEISNKMFDQSAVNVIINSSLMEKLGYSFKDYGIETTEKFELVVNAFNELLGLEPFLEKEDGSFAHSIEEIYKRNYSTNGYMVPRTEDYNLMNPKAKKTLDKAVAKNGGKYHYIMKKAGSN